jgi:hypothetical protein
VLALGCERVEGVVSLLTTLLSHLFACMMKVMLPPVFPYRGMGRSYAAISMSIGESGLLVSAIVGV